MKLFALDIIMVLFGLTLKWRYTWFYAGTAASSVGAVICAHIAASRGEGIISMRIFGGTGVEQMVLTTRVMPFYGRSFRNERRLRGVSYVPLESIATPQPEPQAEEL